MWPILLDMTKDECKRTLRRLELEAYGSIVSALRAQGGLSSEKHKLLQDIASTLNIPQERHRAEIRRAVNDERLTTIAHCMTGDDTSDEWALEGRRLVPLMPRLVPQTAYSVIADEEANKVSLENEKLPLPAQTERKRPLQTNISETVNKHFRVPSESAQKTAIQSPLEDQNSKKRKSNMSVESSSLAQHLMMGQPKISRVQQLYRQKSKALLKSQMKHRVPPSPAPTPGHPPPQTTQKPPTLKSPDEELPPQPEVPILPKTAPSDSGTAPSPPVPDPPRCKPTPQHPPTPPPQKPPVQSAINNVISDKSIKICPARKVITTAPRSQTQPQKVIIVSTSQGTTTSSILQRTLTIPFVKTISMKNLDKVKVINNPTSTSPSKPKLLTVQTKVKSSAGPGAGKPLNIPFIQGVQLQALQNKGAIKMVPLSSTKLTTTKPVVTSGSVYIMNSGLVSSTSAPVTSSTPTTRTPQEETEPPVFLLKNSEPSKLSDLKIADPKIPVTGEGCSGEGVLDGGSKSSVLAEILKASGVLPTDEEQSDIETQITQLTEIPNTSGDEGAEGRQLRVAAGDESVTADNCRENFEQVPISDSPDATNYVILQETEEQPETLLLDEQQQVNEEVVELMGSLDPETGMYSVKSAPQEQEQLQEQLQEQQEYELVDEDVGCQMGAESYVIEMESLHNSDLDMPSLTN